MFLGVALTHRVQLFDTVVHALHKASKLLQPLFAKQHQIIIIIIIIIITRRARPPNGGHLHAPSPMSTAICGRAPVSAARWPSHWLKLLPQTMQYVNALSPPIAGERVGVEGWGGILGILEFNVPLDTV